MKNLDKSKAFFSALGYTFNAQFTDATAASMVISEDIYAMLLVEKLFKTFMLGAEVEHIVGLAFEAGAKNFREPQDPAHIQE